MDPAMKQLMFATDAWDQAMKHPGRVEPTLTFLRSGDQPAWVAGVMDRHDLGDVEMMRAGVTPMIPMRPEVSRQLLKPILAKMDVQGVVYVARGHRVCPEEGKQPIIMLWSLHLPSGSEVVWCRTVRDDGTVSGPVDLEDTGLVGVGWIKEALT